MMRFAQCFLLVVTIGWFAEALADPPKHAPAHGWRKKHDPYYVGFSGYRWGSDYGILSGRCNREEVGTVLGGVIGGVIGNKAGDRDDRVVATIIGAAVGALIGNRIGKELDERDRSCFGHALEIGETGQPVKWANDVTGVRYEMIPGDRNDSYGDGCREYALGATSEDGYSYRSGVACQSETGIWEIAPRRVTADRR